jgi:mono/diheme cytochrome c family protein
MPNSNIGRNRNSLRNRYIRLNQHIRLNKYVCLNKHLFRSGRVRYLLASALAIVAASAQQTSPPPGAAAYQSRCVLCHGGDGTGSDRAPAILDYVAANSTEQIAAIIRNGVPNKGMPAFEMPESELAQLVGYLQTLGGSPGPGSQTARAASESRPRRGGGIPGERRPGEGPLSRTGSITLADGRTLEGTILNESGFDLQLRSSDGKIHRLVRHGETYHEAALEPLSQYYVCVCLIIIRVKYLV